MFDVGGAELAVAALVALLVVKPEDAPKMMRKFGRTWQKIRKATWGITDKFEEWLDEDEQVNYSDIYNVEKYDQIPIDEEFKNDLASQHPIVNEIYGKDDEKNSKPKKSSAKKRKTTKKTATKPRARTAKSNK